MAKYTIETESGADITIVVPDSLDTSPYTLDQYRAKFEQVQNPEHWKYGNVAVVSADELDLTLRAIEWFTANTVETPGFVVCDLQDGTFRVTFPGYYAVCGA